MKNRTEGEINRAFKVIHNKLTREKYKPKVHRIDNKCSASLKDNRLEEGMDYQLVTPYIHRQQLEERAIKTFKEHVLAGRATVDPNFFLDLWCRLFPQAKIFLNMMRASRIHLQLSVYHELMGAFNYNNILFAPIGVKILNHEKPRVR